MNYCRYILTGKTLIYSVSGINKLERPQKVEATYKINIVASVNDIFTVFSFKN